jgi:hypothetical protein
MSGSQEKFSNEDRWSVPYLCPEGEDGGHVVRIVWVQQLPKEPSPLQIIKCPEHGTNAEISYILKMFKV